MRGGDPTELPVRTQGSDHLIFGFVQSGHRQRVAATMISPACPIEPTVTPLALNRALDTLLLSVLALALAGCWTAPVANVQPKGDARLIQRAIPVVAVKNGVTVQSVDAERQTVILNFADGMTSTVSSGAAVANLSKIRAGDKIRATVAQELSVYVLKGGQLPGADGKLESIKSDAKILTIEPSYRLLTLQYPNRRVEILKVGLDADLHSMEAGDDVVIETTQLLALRVQKP